MDGSVVVLDCRVASLLAETGWERVGGAVALLIAKARAREDE